MEIEIRIYLCKAWKAVNYRWKCSFTWSGNRPVRDFVPTISLYLWENIAKDIKLLTRLVFSSIEEIYNVIKMQKVANS